MRTCLYLVNVYRTDSARIHELLTVINWGWRVGVQKRMEWETY